MNVRATIHRVTLVGGCVKVSAYTGDERYCVNFEGGFSVVMAVDPPPNESSQPKNKARKPQGRPQGRNRRVDAMDAPFTASPSIDQPDSNGRCTPVGFHAAISGNWKCLWGEGCDKPIRAVNMKVEWRCCESVLVSLEKLRDCLSEHVRNR